MIRQPVPMPIDETSTEQYNESGTLTTNLSFNDQGIIPFIPDTVDTVIRQPFLMDITDTDTINGNPWVFQVGPVFSKQTPNTYHWQTIFQYFWSYWDADLDVTFRLFKHERSRGRYLITWYPLVQSDEVDVTSTLTNHRVQRWIWDIEQQSIITINLCSPKVNLFRTLNKNRILTPDTTDDYVSFEQVYETPPVLYGTLILSKIVEYDGGGVSNGTATFHVMGQFSNIKTEEFRMISDKGLSTLENSI